MLWAGLFIYINSIRVQIHTQVMLGSHCATVHGTEPEGCIWALKSTITILEA